MKRKNDVVWRNKNYSSSKILKVIIQFIMHTISELESLSLIKLTEMARFTDVVPTSYL